MHSPPPKQTLDLSQPTKLVCLVLVIGFTGLDTHVRAATKLALPELSVGAKAPYFDLETLSGQRLAQSELEQMAYILVIGTSKEPAQGCLLWMDTLVKQYKKTSIGVYQIVVLNNPWYLPEFLVVSRLKDFVPSYGYANVLLEWTFDFATRYQIPLDHDIRVLAINPKGIILHRYRGNMSAEALQQLTNKLKPFIQPSMVKRAQQSRERPHLAPPPEEK
jgi:hypothetical protein